MGIDSLPSVEVVPPHRTTSGGDLIPRATAFAAGLAAGVIGALIILEVATPDRVREAEQRAIEATAKASLAHAKQLRAESDRQRDLALLRDSNAALIEQVEIAERGRQLLLALLAEMGVHPDSSGNLIITGRAAPNTRNEKIIKIGSED